MTVIFVITKSKDFNIEETTQTTCMDFINDNVWCISDCRFLKRGNDEFQSCVCKGSVENACIFALVAPVLRLSP